MADTWESLADDTSEPAAAAAAVPQSWDEDPPAAKPAQAVPGRWDEEEPEEDPTAGLPTGPAPVPGARALTKRQLKKIEDEAERKAVAESADPQARQRKKAEEIQREKDDDLVASRDLFGTDALRPDRSQAHKRTGLDGYELKEAKDFERLANDYATKLGNLLMMEPDPRTKKEKDKCHVDVVKSVQVMLKKLADSLSLEEVQELSKSTATLYNEKLAASKKKKSTAKGKKVNLNVAAAQQKDPLSEFRVQQDDSNDYDFM